MEMEGGKERGSASTESPVLSDAASWGDRRRRLCSSCWLTFVQFFLLLWKNFILQIRRPIGTIFEILIPICAVAVIVGFRLGLFTAEDRCFVTFEPDPLVIPVVPNLVSNNGTSLYNVYYAPNTSEAVRNISRLMAPIIERSGGNLIGVPTQDDFVAAIRRENITNRPRGCFLEGAAVFFDSVNDTNVEYSLRLRQNPAPTDTWFTDFVSRRFQPRGARVRPNFYLNEGFLHLEKIVDEAIIEWSTNSSFDMNVNVRQFPYPPYRRDLFLLIVDFILPLFVILSFIYSAGVFVKELVLEKETRIRETMKIMGLSNWVLWTTWFTKQFLFYLIPIIIMTLLLRFTTVFPKSNPFLVFIYLAMYMISGIAFCFFISVWFSTARIGLMAGFICWFVAYFPYLFVAPNYESISLGPKLGICIVPNSCVGFGVTVISILELRQEGLTFSNFATPLSLDDPIHMGWIVLMLAIDTFVYMLLYWYIDAVKPGVYGVPKPFYFPFLPSYWCGIRRSKPIKPSELAVCGADYNPEAHEPEPTNLPVGIVIDDLTKIYNRRTLRKRKVAVDHLSLKMYKGQITALLGHNGAGKTTTMSILTGLFPPTAGSAHINGLSVVDDIDLIRRNLGICPQHNVLFDRLTVSEHLHFFARLKGAPGGGISAEVNTLIEDLLLKDKRRVKSMNLSGGMKRKLSVAIALVGGSEVVILDEPTSGMDPYARRATWDLLSKHKQGRTILLTTHFMDEADLLGDRIAIMSEGKLRCSGSSLFLKSRYGVGYHMTMVKGSKCDSGLVTGLVKDTVSGAEQVTDVGAELSFLLPSQSAQQFPDLFDILDSRKDELGINSFGVSVTTMEEVFIRVSSGTDDILLETTRAISPTAAAVEGREGEREKSKPFVKVSGNNETSFVTDVEDEDDGLETQTAQMVFANVEADDVTPAPTPAPPSHQTGRPSILQLAEETEITIHGNDAYALNTGFKLWCQQFVAIFLKRFYNSLRFWVAIIWQLIIPLLFVLWGLILGVTTPGFNTDDPSRVLTIRNSAPSDNVIFFHAQFGYDEMSLFSSTDGDVLGATEYFDFTDQIRSIMNSSAEPRNDISSCCNYRFQLLDKYCASRTVNEMNSTCGTNENFGYRPCTECLSCCRAKDNRYQLDTCTNPLLQDTSTAADTSSNAIATDFCPQPPSVAIDDQYSSAPSGSLDDAGVYVAERLLQLSSEFDVYDFSLRYQAGFVLHSTGPTHSTCGCQNNTQQTCAFLSYFLAPNATDPNFDPISTRFLSANSCLILDPPSSCLGVEWDYNYNYVSDVCSSYASCGGETDGFVPQPVQCKCSNSSQCQVGQTSQTPPTGTPPTVTVWYNNQPYHMVAAALNGFYNVYLKSRGQNLTLTVNNNPLPRNLDSQITDAQQEFLGFTISSTAVFGLSFLFASFVIFLVQERDTKAKHLQFVSGVQASSYWLATFAWDLLNSLIPAVLTVILFAAFQIEGYKGENIGAIFLLVLLGCWAAIPVNYVTSFIFSNALVGFCLMLVFFYFGSLIFQVVVFLLIADYPDTAETLNYIFLLHPAYALAIGLANMYTNQGIKNACEQTPQAMMICRVRGVEYAESVFEFLSPGIGHIYLYMAVEGVLFLVLAIIIERNFFIPEIKRLIRSRNRVLAVDNVEEDDTTEDSDVAEEKRKVNGMSSFSDSDAVIVRNLVKEYKDFTATVCPRCSEGGKLAVRSISLLIPNGECFGLLGVNGAGKTTTFKILTGDIAPTSGTALLNGYDIGTQLNQVQQRIGYCPQFDALIERLTGRELLTLFARLRGIPEAAIKGCVQTEIERLDLVKYANKRCGTYSGGNKRKLSTAVSLVGNPPILLLDEPTTGMDPATRRFLWDVLTGIIREGRSVILTSHSMEECEALCTRLAIMVNGQFKCLGSIQHLKSKFGSGYTLQLKVQPKSREEDVKQFSGRVSFRRTQSREAPTSPTVSIANVNHDTAEVEHFISRTFPGSLLLEHHQSSVTYRIPAEGVTWSSLFRTVEEHKEELGIVDYSVSQTTLDQVFINFAQEQEETDM